MPVLLLLLSHATLFTLPTLTYLVCKCVAVAVLAHCPYQIPIYKLLGLNGTLASVYMAIEDFYFRINVKLTITM